MSHPANEEHDELRGQWLEEKGFEEKNVMTDDDGVEYVMTSEGREDLPEEFQPGFEGPDDTDE